MGIRLNAIFNTFNVNGIVESIMMGWVGILITQFLRHEIYEWTQFTFEFLNFVLLNLG